jgi:hypothetical protein
MKRGAMRRLDGAGLSPCFSRSFLLILLCTKEKKTGKSQKSLRCGKKVPNFVAMCRSGAQRLNTPSLIRKSAKVQRKKKRVDLEARNQV